MEALVLCALSATGLALLWWRRPPARDRGAEERLLDEDAQVALHVARHASRSRGQRPHPLHILFGLLQDERVEATITAAGGRPERVEDRVLEFLDGAGEGASAGLEASADPADEADLAARAVTWALHVAVGADRRAGCTELWGALAKFSPSVRACVGHGGASAADVLFALVHDIPSDRREVPEQGEVQVVLFNDDLTSRDLVVEILRDDFELGEEDANAAMLRAHNEGRARFGRFPAQWARGALARATRRARAQGAPLRLELAPAS